MNQFLDLAATEFAIVMAFVVFQNIKIYRSIDLIGKTGLQDFFDEFNLLNDVSCGRGFNGGAFLACLSRKRKRPCLLALFVFAVAPNRRMHKSTMVSAKLCS